MNYKYERSLKTFIFIIALFLGYRGHARYTNNKLHSAWLDLVDYRDCLTLFQDYLENHKAHQTDTAHTLICKKFQEQTEEAYEKHKNSTLAFPYLLFLAPEVCDSTENLNIIIKVFDQAYEKFNATKRINNFNFFNPFKS